MTSQPGKRTIALYTLPNISRSKHNQTMKLGQLIEYNMINIFLKTSYTKYGRETIPRLFSKKLKLSTSLNQKSKVLYILFLRYAKLRTIKIYWNQIADHLLLPHMKLFKKQKRSRTSLPTSVFVWFLKKIFILLYSINWQNFIVWLPLLSWNIGQHVYCNCLLT